MNEVRFARAAQSEPLHEPETLAHEHVRPGIVVGKVLRHDALPPPENLLEDPGLRLGTDPVPAYRYFSKDYAQLEKEKLWPKVWQFACRLAHRQPAGGALLFQQLSSGNYRLSAREAAASALTHPHVLSAAHRPICVEARIILSRCADKVSRPEILRRGIS